MPKRVVDTTSPCPIGEVIAAFGGKWKPAILFHLEKESPLRFGELRRRIPEVSQRMLTQQLRELERDGFVHREHFAEIPPRVEYRPTDLARSLTNIFQAIEAWSKKYSGQIHQERDAYDSLQHSASK